MKRSEMKPDAGSPKEKKNMWQLKCHFGRLNDRKFEYNRQLILTIKLNDRESGNPKTKIP